ncbi:MAG TPA: DUF4062 domain-containing protein [Thermomicrobiales bacterium]|jgi:hypothetical protein
MQQVNSRPRVFVSSTIIDFRDLRSALKFWLEELDFEVQLSEFTDFSRRPDQGTFESCFEVIASCQYYILLVGGRRGSNYTDNVSVTQQEYRIAADLAKQGKISPIIFVRSDVATALSERSAISRASRNQDAEVVEALAAPSGTVDDPVFTKAFIDEINRTQYGSPTQYGPSGSMWYYRFSNFRDIADALRVNLLLLRPLRRQAQLANVRSELESNLSALIDKRKDGTLAPFYSRWLTLVRHLVPLPQQTFGTNVWLTSPQANLVAGFWYLSPSADRLHTTALNEAILSGEFLYYDQSSKMLATTEIYDAMRSLFTLIGAYRSVNSILAGRESARAQFNLERQQGQGANIHADDLLWLYAAHDRMQDVTRLSIALLRYILDPSKPFKLPQMNPRSPLSGESEKIDAEHPTATDLANWIFTDGATF